MGLLLYLPINGGRVGVWIRMHGCPVCLVARPHIYSQPKITVVMLLRLRGGGYCLSGLGEVAGRVAPQIIFSNAKFNIDGKTAIKIIHTFFRLYIQLLCFRLFLLP